MGQVFADFVILIYKTRECIMVHTIPFVKPLTLHRVHVCGNRLS